MRLRSHLVLHVLAALLPLLVFTAFIVYRDLAEQREILERGMRNTARALSLALDGEVKAYRRTLETLAVSPVLAADDYALFHTLSSQALAGYAGAYIVLFDRDGQQLVNTTKPFGTPLPNPLGQAQPPAADPRYPQLPMGGPAIVREVLKTGRAAVSDLFVALDWRRPIVGIAVPVTRDGAVRYVLEIALEPEPLIQLLRSHRLPDDSVVSLLDRKGAIIASTLNPSGGLGQRLAPELATQAASAEEGIGRGRTHEGLEVVHFFTRSAATGWTVSLGVSEKVLGAPLGRALAALVGGVGIAVLLGMMAAIGIGRRIAQPISLLATSAGALARGERSELNVPAIYELQNLHGALVSAGEAVRQAAAEREQHLVAQESERQFRLIADSAPVLIWTSDTDRLCTWFNKPWLDFVGRPMAKELGNGWAENVHPEDFDRCLKIYARSFDAREPFSMECRLRRHDGEYRWIRDDGIPRFAMDGSFAGYIGACIDITDSKGAEQAALEAGERMRSVVDHTVDGIITIDEQGIVQTFNPAAEEIFGYAASAVVGQNVKMLMPERYSREHDAYIANYVRTGQAKIIGIGREVEGRRKDGSIFPLDLAVSVFHIGQRRYFTGLVRDITERKQVEEALHRANQAKDEFLAMLSHELRNPLAALTSAAHVLKVVSPSSEEATKARSVVERQTKHMSRLIGDLLDISRVTVGKLALQAERFDLAEAVSGVVNTARASGQLNAHAVSLSVEPAWVHADRARIEQISVNLLENALKFSPAGKAIAIEVKREDSDAVLRVSDQGLGIDAQDCSRIFDLFVQGESVSGVGGGLGIGLALVKRLAELHGGSVSAASEGHWRGATFTVRLPAVERLEAQPAAATDQPSHERSIIIIEDNDDARQMLEAALRLGGHQVRAARDGHTGLALVAAATPDIAFIDIALPDMDGYEVARRLRSLKGRGRIVLVAVTGFGQVDDQRRAYEAGFDAHLVKPATPERLHQLISQFR